MSTSFGLLARSVDRMEEVLSKQAMGARLPTFLVIGAMRAGTTSLAQYLMQHPAVFIPPEKELHFFSRDRAYAEGFDSYARRFRAAPPGSVVGEATPHYMTHRDAPSRIAEAMPGVRLVAILRNPVDRAWSHYWLNRVWWGERRNFIDATREDYVGNGPPHSYLTTGMYVRHLRRVCESFERDALHVVLLDDLRDDPTTTFRKICEFIGVDGDAAPPTLGWAYNHAVRVRSTKLWFALEPLRYRAFASRWVNAIDDWNLDRQLPFTYPRMPAPWREELVEWYAEYNAELAEWLGWDLSSWNK